ncbi:MAG: hypothetical protein EOO10_15220 [Chitinophagaceae bacterium]|nr:MAG: hypothetical protein EOO10_15220 [Chitinophagaceae bacterium]
MPDSVVAKQAFVFNSVSKAAEKLTNGTEATPMVLYLAPYVYWIDNPDDTAIRVPKEGSTPYGLVIKCDWLKFQGLNENAENVVLASNRGQTIGAKGNFTMFRFIGQGTGSENVTFGNYCNVDLVFPLKPSLNRKKRASAIVQAQLIHCNGDKIVARNTRFISRLNLCPFVGGKRVLFDRCHFESTDDALCGTGVYLNSTLDFYSSKPFYNTTGTGAVFLNCDIRSLAGSQQYFTKAKGQVAVIDSRFTGAANSYWAWQDVVPLETRNYQSNVSLNGQPLFIGKRDAASTIDLANKNAVNAYRFMHNGNVVYNTYNLLRGDDDWDPMNVKAIVIAAEKASNKTYTNIPVQLLVSPTSSSVETGKNGVELKASLMRFGNYTAGNEKIFWAVADKDKLLVVVKPGDDGKSCTVIPNNKTDETKKVVIRAYTASGLEGASTVVVAPPILEAPTFTKTPSLVLNKKGIVRLDYALSSTYSDMSDVKWFRCSDAKGSDAIEIAVSRFDQPLKEYRLSPGDVGYYIMASVAPKHIRSMLGESVHIVMQKPIDKSDVETNKKLLVTDFKNLSTKNQPRVIPGFWTWGYPESNEVDARNTIDKAKDAWYYSEGADGAANMVGLLQVRSGSISYTPVGHSFNDMTLTMSVAPFKTAGQGFSVAHLYMDVLIKYDAKTKTGYALRFIRTTKHGDAVDCLLMKYENGRAIAISESVSTTAFRTLCTITLEEKNNKLLAQVTTSAGQTGNREGIVNEVKLESSITPNAFGGFGIEYNGGSPTMIREVKVEWQ